MVLFWFFLQTSAAGWTLDCLQEWGLFIKLAIPSMLMICLSWWIFEIGGFLAGVISEVELGAQSIAYQLCIVAYMVTFFSFFLSCFWRDYFIHPFIFYCFHETVKLITLITPLITF